MLGPFGRMQERHAGTDRRPLPRGEGMVSGAARPRRGPLHGDGPSGGASSDHFLWACLDRTVRTDIVLSGYLDGRIV
jgi:hypothetical protein